MRSQSIRSRKSSVVDAAASLLRQKGIEGWLEGVPGLHKGLIDRNQGSGLTKNQFKKKVLKSASGEPVCDFDK